MTDKYLISSSRDTECLSFSSTGYTQGVSPSSVQQLTAIHSEISKHTHTSKMEDIDSSTSTKAILSFRNVHGETVATAAFASYPLKFIIPRSLGSVSNRMQCEQAETPLALSVYLVTYGGGILAGDCVSLDVTLEDTSTVLFLTQASTKIYKSINTSSAAQDMFVKVCNGALLALVPDPVVCFQNARYEQTQTFQLEQTGSLFVVDWLLSGRMARGERWAFDLYRSQNTVTWGGQEVVHDSLLLSDSSSANAKLLPTVSERMGSFEVSGTVIVLGPRLVDLSRSLLTDLSSQDVQNTSWTHPLVVHSVSQLHFSKDGAVLTGCIVRFMATSSELAMQFVMNQCRLLSSALGDDPWKKKV
eukprot:GILK01007403.1.p1 GENE.GILK01007403.1~~GILK01007403.1.p1  ORF type:complete len:359 (+),score=49.02 GILK01007403.1:810-1886(+)